MRVPPRMLFCLPHWRKVPAHLQRAVWKAYRPGQEVAKNPSALYLVVQAIVVAWVAKREGLWSEDQYLEHIKGRLELAWHRLTDSDLDFIRALVA